MLSTVPAPAPLLVDVHDAAKLLGLSVKTVGVWAVQGKLPSIKLGESRRFSVKALEEFIAAEHERQRQASGGCHPTIN